MINHEIIDYIVENGRDSSTDGFEFQECIYSHNWCYE